MWETGLFFLTVSLQQSWYNDVACYLRYTLPLVDPRSLFSALGLGDFFLSRSVGVTRSEEGEGENFFPGFCYIYLGKRRWWRSMPPPLLKLPLSLPPLLFSTADVLLLLLLTHNSAVPPFSFQAVFWIFEQKIGKVAALFPLCTTPAPFSFLLPKLFYDLCPHFSSSSSPLH